MKRGAHDASMDVGGWVRARLCTNGRAEQKSVLVAALASDLGMNLGERAHWHACKARVESAGCSELCLF